MSESDHKNVTSISSEQVELLERLGMIPPQCDFKSLDLNKSLIERLGDAWTNWLRVAPANRRSSAVRCSSWLKAAIDSGAEFTFDAGHISSDRIAEEIGPRLFWWPDGIPNAHLIAIVGSRSNRHVRSEKSTRTMIDFACRSGIRNTDMLMTATGAAQSPTIIESARNARQRLLLIEAASNAGNLKNWFKRLTEFPHDADRHSDTWRVGVSPTAVRVPPADTSSETPIRDQLTFLLAHQIRVAHVRPGGNIDRLLHCALRGTANGTIRILMPPDSSPDSTLRSMFERGAVPWYMSTQDEGTDIAHVSEDAVSTPENSIARSAMLYSICESIEERSNWLVHWTRAARQTNTRHAPTQSNSGSRTACQMLQQIVGENRIRASNDGLRAGKRMVCFSGVPLRNLVKRRVYRRHRMRFDFEHYGVGLSKTRLQNAGARTVVYGDDETWQSLPEPEKPWFQVMSSGSGGSKIDWSIENEWRILGDVSFEQFGQNELFIFCSSESERRILAAACPWHVISIEELPAIDVDESTQER